MKKISTFIENMGDEAMDHKMDLKELKNSFSLEVRRIDFFSSELVYNKCCNGLNLTHPIWPWRHYVP